MPVSNASASDIYTLRRASPGGMRALDVNTISSSLELSGIIRALLRCFLMLCRHYFRLTKHYPRGTHSARDKLQLTLFIFPSQNIGPYPYVPR